MRAFRNATLWVATLGQGEGEGEGEGEAESEGSGEGEGEGGGDIAPCFSRCSSSMKRAR